MFIEHSADLNIQDKDGKTPLHYACSQGMKDFVIMLLMEKADYTIPDKANFSPGEDDPDMSIFIGDITDEEKCFKILSPEQAEKLSEIFKDIDHDRMGRIDLQKSYKFNLFLEPDTVKNNLRRDAEDFIKSCAIITKGEVILEEWLFSFAKLYFVDKPAFNKFVEDYDRRVKEEQSTFTEVIMNSETNQEEA